eukprot:scaffold6781_cov204-Amphora_coffeaeformis.AAC.3
MPLRIMPRAMTSRSVRRTSRIYGLPMGQNPLVVLGCVWISAILCAIAFHKGTEVLYEARNVHWLESSSASATTTTTTSNGIPSYYAPVTGRMDFWAPHDDDDDPDPSGIGSSSSSAKNILQVVSHRELLIGCNSFEEFLSPHFHTLLVFPRHVAELLQLPDLIRRASAQQTAGVHLFLTEADVWAGSHMARRIAERFARHELDTKVGGPKIRYLSAINCDVHPLPPTHERYQPLEQIVLTMARDLQLANEYQGPGQPIHSSLVGNYNTQGYAIDGQGDALENGKDYINHQIINTPHAQRRILAMNTVLFEDVPDNTSLEKFHGIDNVDWWAKGGWDRRQEAMATLQQRRRSIGGTTQNRETPDEKVENLPWLQDESNFFEDHMILFDLDFLREFSDVYFAVAPEAFVDENSFLGPMAAQHGFTLVRHNDLVLRIQFGHDTVPFPPSVDVDEIRRLNWQILGHFRSPRSMAANWERAASMAHVHTEHKPFIPFVYIHCRRHVWFPHDWKNPTRITDPNVLPIVDAYLAYNGYVRLSNDDGHLHQTKVLQYGLDGVHPASRLVSFGKQTNARQKRLFSMPRSLSTKGKTLKFKRIYADFAVAGPPDFNRTAVLEIPTKMMISPLWFDACREQ